jgi:hypothetical protein
MASTGFLIVTCLLSINLSPPTCPAPAPAPSPAPLGIRSNRCQCCAVGPSVHLIHRLKPFPTILFLLLLLLLSLGYLN